MKMYLLTLLIIALLIVSCTTEVTKPESPPSLAEGKRPAAEKPVTAPPTTTPAPLTETPTIHTYPNFIPAMRMYEALQKGDEQTDYVATQFDGVKELGINYVQGIPSFYYWGIISHDKSGNAVWKWAPTDEQMDSLASRGLKAIPFIISPKMGGLPWDESITRDDPRYAQVYEDFAYEMVNRYKNHPAWSGIVAVWGGSSDIWDKEFPGTNPEVVIPLLNAAYDGIKRAEPNTIVIGFNFATTGAHDKETWELFHTRAFAQNPKFDWYGAQSHEVFTTELSDDYYGGIQGLTRIRSYLDNHGYADKPLWVNEGGFSFDKGKQGLPPGTIQTEQVIETFIVGSTIPNLKGWVYFAYMGSTDEDDPGVTGLMEPRSSGWPPRPREAYNALKVLGNTVNFFDYQFDSKIVGEVNQLNPYILKFVKKEQPNSKLWVVFSPRLHQSNQEPVTHEVTINIAPAVQIIKIDMLGQQSTLTADASGNVRVTSTSSPVYLKTN